MATTTASGTRVRRPSARKKWRSRAVTRLIEAGSTVECAHCGERIKFRAKVRQYQVICNVYVKSKWDRVEHYHDECYIAAGSPHGKPSE